MGKNDRQSRDQKRKAKLKKRALRSRKHESLAYSGKKYKTDEFVPIFYRTERGIYESYVMCDRELIDDEVEAAIERLVIQMREGPLPPLPPLPATGVMTFTEGGEEDLIITNIRRNWRILEEKGELPGQDDLIGILRTTLHSLSIWRSQSLDSQGYLRYIEGFMKKLGVSVRPATPDFQPLPEPPEDPLLLLGRTGITNEDEAVGAEFVDQVESLIRSGDAQRVMEVCQQLMGETQDLPVVVLIKEMAVRAERALRIEMG
jgi:hypothetical protein